jgi:hypothetical protein
MIYFGRLCENLPLGCLGLRKTQQAAKNIKRNHNTTPISGKSHGVSKFSPGVIKSMLYIKQD